ncbi:MAG TPA: hypothetical protein VMT76_13005 [Puia sp.]|nr:hypothetical protein [Puia sp.]
MKIQIIGIGLRVLAIRDDYILISLMQSQKALVDVAGKFTPKIVKMDGAKHRGWKNKKNEYKVVEGE